MGRSDGISIGAHTVDHLMLPEYPESDQIWQMQQSREQLEEITGNPVTTFAYPHGAYSRETVRAVRDSGFECAVTVEQKIAFPDTDPVLLPLFGVKNHHADEFRQQLETWFGHATTS